MARGLWFRFEFLGCDCHAVISVLELRPCTIRGCVESVLEMRLFRSTIGHGGMMRMQVRVVAYDQCRRRECGDELYDTVSLWYGVCLCGIALSHLVPHAVFHGRCRRVRGRRHSDARRGRKNAPSGYPGGGQEHEY